MTLSQGSLCFLTSMLYEHMSYLHAQENTWVSANVMQNKCTKASVTRRERNLRGALQKQQTGGPLLIHVIVNNFTVPSPYAETHIVYCNSFTASYTLTTQQQSL